MILLCMGIPLSDRGEVHPEVFAARGRLVQELTWPRATGRRRGGRNGPAALQADRERPGAGVSAPPATRSGSGRSPCPLTSNDPTASGTCPPVICHSTYTCRAVLSAGSPDGTSHAVPPVTISRAAGADEPAAVSTISRQEPACTQPAVGPAGPLPEESTPPATAPPAIRTAAAAALAIVARSRRRRWRPARSAGAAGRRPSRRAGRAAPVPVSPEAAAMMRSRSCSLGWPGVGSRRAVGQGGRDSPGSP